MPVTATPVSPTAGCDTAPATPSQPAPVPVSCLSQQVIVPAEPKDPVTGSLLLSRTRAVVVPQDTATAIRHVMRSPTGEPVSLEACVCDSSVSTSESSSSEACPCEYQLRFRLREQLSGGGAELAATAVDAANGELQVNLSVEETALPGIYFGEFLIQECETCVTVFSNVLYVIIGGQNYSSGYGCSMGSGPPTIAEMRMFLRDSDPAESSLLTTFAFSDEELGAALTMPVRYWNEIPPDISRFDTHSFPFRYHWMIGATGHLYRTVAEKMRRNELQFQTSGVTVRDQAKESSYEAVGSRRLEEYYNFVRRKKAELNMLQCFGGIGSSYG